MTKYLDSCLFAGWVSSNVPIMVTMAPAKILLLRIRYQLSSARAQPGGRGASAAIYLSFLLLVATRYYLKTNYGSGAAQVLYKLRISLENVWKQKHLLLAH